MFTPVRIGNQPDPGLSIYGIGHLIRQGECGSPEIIMVTATMSRKNSMAQAGGWHIALATEPSLSWAQARMKDIYAADLLAVFQRNEASVLSALFPILQAGEIACLACAVGGNTEHTANRKDMHAHIQVAHRGTWSSGRVRRMVDDARPPRIIAGLALAEAGMYGHDQVAILDMMYPPEKK